MRKRSKVAICAVVFLLLVALVIEGESALCRRSSWVAAPNGYTAYCNLNNLTDFPIDVVAFGSSMCAGSFAALELYEQYGISAYNVGGSWQPMMISYLLLNQLLEFESPQVVFLEIFSFFTVVEESWYRLGFDALPLSKIKWAQIEEHSQNENAESKFSYIFNISKYHFAWKSLKEYGFSLSDQARDMLLHHGFYLRTKVYNPSNKNMNFYGLIDGESDRADYGNEEYEYICKFIELCQEKGIDVVLYKSYITETYWSLERHNTIQDIADRYKIPFVDFNMHDVLIASEGDYFTDLDDDAHTNFLGAKKVTRYLGKYLHENYDLPDHRNDPKYKELEAANERFQRILLGEQMVMIQDMSTYFDRLWDLNGQNYTVFFSVKDDCQRGLDDNLKAKLKKLGFKSYDVFNEYGHSFIGIWQNGRVIYEDSSEGIDDAESDALEYRGVLSNDMKYYIKSAGYRCGNTSSIIIDGTEYSKNNRGFNIVVYDNVNGWIVDSIVFDTHADAGITYKR